MAKVAMLFAAGKGERLKELTKETPKPLLPLGQSTILSRILDELEAQKFDRVVVNAFYQKEKLISFLREEAKSRSFEIRISEEAELLGTAGGLKKALPLIEASNFHVLNGDVVFKMNWTSWDQAIESETELEGLWALVSSRPEQTSISLNEKREIIGIGELWGEENPGGYGFSGLQYFRSLDPSRLPNKGCLVRDYWIPLLRESNCLRGVPELFEVWEDLGTPERYQFWHRQLQNDSSLR